MRCSRRRTFLTCPAPTAAPATPRPPTRSEALVPTNMSAAKHAFVPTSCDTCHEAGLSFYMGASTPALQGRPADHLASGNPQQVVRRLLASATKPPTGTATSCRPATCRTPATRPARCATPRSAPPTGELRDARQHRGTAHRHHRQLRAMPWRDDAADLLQQQRQPEDPGCSRRRTFRICPGTDCSSCHAANYVTGGFGPTNMSAAKHAFVPTTCDTCHEAGLSFYLGASTPALQGRPADHMSRTGTPQQQTGDCSGCHNTTDWKTTVMPAGHMPNPGNQTCSVCHTAISGSAASYATLASVAVLHTGISGNCGQCHGSPSAALTFYNNNDNPKAAVLVAGPHSVSHRHRLQLLSCRQLCRGRLRSDQHERSEARLRAHHLRYLPRGGVDASTWAHRLRLCRGGRPITSRRPTRLPGDRRLLAVPQHDRSGPRRPRCRTATCRIPAPDLLGLPRRKSEHARQATPRWRAFRCCTPASAAAAPNATAARRR